MKNNNILQLNMVRDNFYSMNGNCQVGLCAIKVENKPMFGMVVEFEELQYFQVTFLGMMLKFIFDKYGYELGISMDEKNKAFFVYDDKHNIAQKKFNKIYKDLMSNLSIIEKDATKYCAFMFSSQTKQEAKKEFEQIMENLRPFPSNDKKGEC